jgi:acyl-CoA reductase-like NAD-dependent aldehyde dehydrogenase
VAHNTWFRILVCPARQRRVNRYRQRVAVATGSGHGLFGNGETEMGSLISHAHRDRVHGFVERGRQEGAELVVGGEFGDGEGAF